MNDMRFNPFAKNFSAAPYAHYRDLREQDPVHRSAMGIWVLTRYAEVSQVLRDPSYSSEVSRWPGFAQRYRSRPGVAWLLTHSVLNRDEPDHKPLRRAIIQAFSPASEGRLARMIDDILEQRLNALDGDQDFDAVGDFALPVPVSTVCRVFDVASADHAQVKAWSNQVASLIEPLPAAPVLGDAAAGIAAFKEYLREKMECPEDAGLAGDLMRSMQEHPVGLEDALANLVLMFPAGHETTVNLIGNGLLLLLRHPEQRRLLREQPDLWPKAIEEILRVESPQQIAWRVATQDHELAGKRIAAGDQLMLVLGAANRDPEVFEDPERFDITRTNNRHVAFGLGRHACLGGWFARMQGQRALQAIVARFPRLSLAGAPLWHPTVSFHGLRHLPVTRAPAFPNGGQQ